MERPVLKSPSKPSPWLKTRTPRLQQPPQRLSSLWAAVLILSSCASCAPKPTYPKTELPKAVQDLCRREYDLTVDARFVGRTFYVSTVLDGLVGRDLGLQQETLKKLEGAMLNATRVSLSTDADINFLILKARDSRLGVTVTLARYLPDIKSLIYMRISRDDFENRLVLETTSSLEADSPDEWKDMSMTEFMARLTASRLQRQFSANPLINTFLQIKQVQGSFQAGTMRLRLDKFEHDPDTDLLVQEILRTGVEDVVSNVVRMYGAREIVKNVLVEDDTGRKLLELKTREILEKKREEKKVPAAS